FIMAQLLLQYDADPDYPGSSEDPTPLMIAAHNEDQEYAWLLLLYFANPYYAALSAFDVEKGKPRGWLREIFETIKKQRSFNFKYWFLRDYIPQDVIRLIMHYLIESYKKQI